MKQTEAEREESRQDQQRLSRRFEKILAGVECSSTRNLAEEMAAAEKRVADYHRDGAEVRALERMYNNVQ